MAENWPHWALHWLIADLDDLHSVKGRITVVIHLLWITTIRICHYDWWRSRHKECRNPDFSKMLARSFSESSQRSKKDECNHNERCKVDQLMDRINMIEYEWMKEEETQDGSFSDTLSRERRMIERRRFFFITSWLYDKQCNRSIYTSIGS